MDIPVHNQILWEACQLARRRLGAQPKIADPVDFFPLLCRGSWMNDTNQATVLTDVIEGKAPQVTQEVRKCMQALWQVHLAELIAAMATLDPAAAARAKDKAALAQDVDEFGSYQRFDHLDILRDDPAPEYGALDAEQLASTVGKMHKVCAERFKRVTANAEPVDRLSTSGVTALGRALHTVADFFAHTNYVELLLWSLAERGAISPHLGAFNAAQTAYEKENPELVCPLPVNGVKAPVAGGILWYGPSAAETPLVSTVFDTEDTAYSLTKIYATQLQNPHVRSANQRELALILAIVDVPGRPLAEAAWKVYKAFDAALEAVSNVAKDWLADRLIDHSKDAGAGKDALEAAAEILRKYDVAEAGQWARAGKMHYVAHLVEQRMSRKLDGQTTAAAKLPHHTLLSKDHPPHTAEGICRYALACALATEVSAELLVWHFSEKPGDFADRFEQIARQWLRHPARQLAEAKSPFAVELAPLVGRAFSTPWQLLPMNAPLLVLR